MSILKDWYCGHLHPDEEIISHNPEYRPINRKIGDEREHFRNRLLPVDKQRFEEWNELILQSSSMNAYANFIYGFKLGALLMCEVFSGDDGEV